MLETSLSALVKKLAFALREYGAHTKECKSKTGWSTFDICKCTCGLAGYLALNDEALAAYEAGLKEVPDA